MLLERLTSLAGSRPSPPWSPGSWRCRILGHKRPLPHLDLREPTGYRFGRSAAGSSETPDLVYLKQVRTRLSRVREGTELEARRADIEA